jgi:hypothetical protein
MKSVPMNAIIGFTKSVDKNDLNEKQKNIYKP